MSLSVVNKIQGFAESKIASLATVKFCIPIKVPFAGGKCLTPSNLCGLLISLTTLKCCHPILFNLILSNSISSIKIDTVKSRVQFFSWYVTVNLTAPYRLTVPASTFDWGLTNHLASSCPSTFVSNQRHILCCMFVIYIVFATLAAVVPTCSDRQQKPRPFTIPLAILPLSADPSGGTSVGIKSLYFPLMMSFGGDQFRTSGTIPQVQVTLNQINTDPTLLPGYQLHYTLTDSQACAMWHC